MRWISLLAYPRYMQVCLFFVARTQFNVTYNTTCSFNIPTRSGPGTVKCLDFQFFTSHLL